MKIDGLKWVRSLYCYPSFFTDSSLMSLLLRIRFANMWIYRCSMRAILCSEICTVRIRVNRSKLCSKRFVSVFLANYDSFDLHCRLPGGDSSGNQTLRDFIAAQRFDKVGVFTYSREEDTPAYNIPNQVPERISCRSAIWAHEPAMQDFGRNDRF